MRLRGMSGYDRHAVSQWMCVREEGATTRWAVCHRLARESRVKAQYARRDVNVSC